MENNELNLNSISNNNLIILRVSKFKAVPMLIILLLTSIVGIRALSSLPHLIANEPHPPSPNLEPYLYTAEQVEYEMKMHLFQLQLAYFGGMVFIWFSGIFFFVWIAVRISASITIDENGIFLSRKFKLSTNNEIWQNIRLMTVEVTKGRRSENSLKFVIETLENHRYQVIISFLDYITVCSFKRDLKNITKQFSPLMYQSEKSTDELHIKSKKVVWHWEITP